MLTMLTECRKSKTNICAICSKKLHDTISFPDICQDLFHYKCLRDYADSRLEKSEPVTCPQCQKYFGRIANKYRTSGEIIFQNVILSNDESQCCICFNRFRIPVASPDTCSHVFCLECIKKWCTFKNECPMDRRPIKLLIVCEFPGGHIIKKVEPPPIKHDAAEGENDDVINTTCEICHLGDNDDRLLLCDNCNKGYHMYCLSEPLNEIPEGDWFCGECSRQISSGNTNSYSNSGFARGLGDVIRDLEVRVINDTNTRRTRTENGRGRIRRQVNIRNVHLSESDNEIRFLNYVSTRSRRRGQQSSNSVRRREIVDEEDESIELRNNRRTRRRVIEESEDESTHVNENQASSSNSTTTTTITTTNESSSSSDSQEENTVDSDLDCEVQRLRRVSESTTTTSTESDSSFHLDEDEEEDDDEVVVKARLPSVRRSTRKNKRKSGRSKTLVKMDEKEGTSNVVINRHSKQRVRHARQTMVFDDDDDDDGKEDLLNAQNSKRPVRQCTRNSRPVTSDEDTLTSIKRPVRQCTRNNRVIATELASDDEDSVGDLMKRPVRQCTRNRSAAALFEDDDDDDCTLNNSRSTKSSTVDEAIEQSNEHSISVSKSIIYPVRQKVQIRHVQLSNDEPISRPAKCPRLIEGDDDFNSNVKTVALGVVGSLQADQCTVESTSVTQQQFSDDNRSRHISSSSSLSTIPCRLAGSAINCLPSSSSNNHHYNYNNNAEITDSSTAIDSSESSTTGTHSCSVSDINSSGTNDSDYVPQRFKSTLKRKPKQKKTSRKKAKVHHLTKRITTKKKKIKRRKGSFNRKSFIKESPRKLSISGEGMQILPFVNDTSNDEVPTFTPSERRPIVQTGSLLSDISKAQSNFFRQMSFKTIDRLSDGTIVPRLSDKSEKSPTRLILLTKSVSSKQPPTLTVSSTTANEQPSCSSSSIPNKQHPSKTIVLKNSSCNSIDNHRSVQSKIEIVCSSKYPESTNGYKQSVSAVDNGIDINIIPEKRSQFAGKRKLSNNRNDVIDTVADDAPAVATSTSQSFRQACQSSSQQSSERDSPKISSRNNSIILSPSDVIFFVKSSVTTKYPELNLTACECGRVVNRIVRKIEDKRLDAGKARKFDETSIQKYVNKYMLYVKRLKEKARV